ncbi:hypothetical protein PV11_00328 [Exophiala sideris]|uniref:Major royal jelly protein n=1 Tax=Exophiala sideris TaxID=1016849 RepID=A0A0D1W7A6_9EURO|nr:hypothetical protein PV11_00328 [Exophiala sideris]
MSWKLLLVSALAVHVVAQFPSTCPAIVSAGPNGTYGICPQDFTIIGGSLEPVHESTRAPTGFAVDPSLNIYLTYPRNQGATPNNVVIATSFTGEQPWPNAAYQNCTPTQNVSTCFINVQNVVLDSINQLWIVDSGIAPGNKSATPGGAKIMSFDLSGNLLATYLIPLSLYHDNLNINDVRINNTLGGGKGYAFLTDESADGSIVSINLDNGTVNRRLFNTTVVKSDPGYVGVYDGQPIYSWNGTNRVFSTIGSDGIALASGNVYWGVLSSRRFYYVSQEVVVDNSLSDEQVLAAVQNPGECGTEQAGFTADDSGRVYILASEHNAIFYVDTLQSQVNETVDGVPPGGPPLVPVPPERYVVKTLVRNALIQHADSAAIYDGWLYFSTNQLEFSPQFSYNNTDNRRGPFRSYKTWVGAGPAV